MNDWRLLTHNRVTGVKTYARFEGEMMICKEVFSVGAANELADAVAERRAEESTEWKHRLRRSTQEHRTHIATLPAIIVNQLMRDGIWEDGVKLSQWLNDPSNSMWRTGGGHVEIRDR